MSRNEDYLDNLLTSVTDTLSGFDDDFEQNNRESLKQSYQTQQNLPSNTQSALDEIREDNFLKEFEEELRGSDGADDAFMREFEQELNGGAGLYDPPIPDSGTLRPDGTQDGLSGLFDSLDTDGLGPSDNLTQMLDSGQPEGAGDDLASLLDPGPDDTDLFQTGQPGSFTEDLSGDSQTLQPDGPAQGMEGLSDLPQPDDMAQALSEGPDTAAAEPDTLSQEDLDALFQNNSTDSSPDKGAGQMEDNFLDDITKQMQDSFPDEDELLREISDTTETAGSVPGQEIEAPKGMEGLEDIFGDASNTQPGGGQAQNAGMLDDGLEQILNTSDDDALSELSQMLDADSQGAAGGQDPLSAAGGPDFSFSESDLGADEPGKKRKKEKNPNSPLAKLSRILFGTPEELDPEAAAAYAAANPEINIDPKEAKEKKKQEKELKKQKKQEKEKKKKKEKEAAKAEKEAKKASKPKKEKKPKPPKKKAPKEPPLPKVPVTMMWMIALSIMVLVFLGSTLVGYSSPVSESKAAFQKGDYVAAYTKLKGLKIKKADKELYNASAALAGIQTELDAYTALMEHKQYELALDALVRGYGRCAIHSSEAEEWGVSKELSELEGKLEQLLKEQFDVSKRTAKKLYKIKKRVDYTLELQKILEKLGLVE